VGDIASTVGQILDKLSDVVLGPVQGTITASSTAGTVKIPQGQQVKLPDGRLLRVRKTTNVTTTPKVVPCRLYWLSPSVPAAANFAAIAAGLTATWQSPPTNTNATGTTSLFAKHARACLGSVVRQHQLTNPADLFAAGSNGQAVGILMPARLRKSGIGMMKHREMQLEAQWTLRVNANQYSPKDGVIVSIDSIFDKLKDSLLGATVGSGQVRFDSWEPVKTEGSTISYELKFSTQIIAEGRVMDSSYAADPELSVFDSSMTVNDDGVTPNPWKIEQEFDVNP
jgi:hypothetical protein